jgi:immune inhibitor A
MTEQMKHDYAYGPTSCAPTRAVLRSVQREIKASRALSRGDIRLATAMGLISANTRRPLGYGDGVFYPPTDTPLAAPTRGVSPVARISLATAAPATRTLHALALLVDFSDNPGTRPAADFQRLLFDATNPDSMTSIYRDLSYGALNVTGEAVGYIRAPRPYSFYTAGESGTGENFPKNTPGLLVDALTAFTQTDNLSRFDVDGDGYVDGIFLIHAGGGAEAEPDPAKRPHMIWSHKWVLPQPFVHQGVRVYAYSTEPEDGRVGVFAHEFGHVLGLPDLYDTTYRSRGVGDWCLMAGGSWGGGGNTPTRMSCWCLARLGWVKPKVVKTARTLKLSTLEADKKDCYRLWTKGAKGPEYFLIENRQAAGRDRSLPGSGLALWHVDETQTGNTNPLAYMVGLVQADGKRDLEFNRNDGDAGDLFPGSAGVKKVDDTTTPSTRANNGAASKVALTQISEKNGVVSVRVKV